MEVKYTQTFVDSMERLFSNNPKYLIPRVFNRLKCQIRWFFQRRSRGFGDNEIWDMHSYITDFIRPRLKEFIRQYKQNEDGCPGNLLYDKDGNTIRNVTEGVEKWKEILDLMNESFDLLYEYEHGSESWYKKTTDEHIKDNEKIQQGLELFGKYYQSLWN